MKHLTLKIMEPKTLGARIKQARLSAKLTQQRLADKVRVTRSAVSQWETGDIEGIEASNLVAAAKALRVSVDWLLSGASGVAARVAEPGTPYRPEPPHSLADIWEKLTTSQQNILMDQARSMAAMNQQILDELKDR